MNTSENRSEAEASLTGPDEVAGVVKELRSKVREAADEYSGECFGAAMREESGPDDTAFMAAFDAALQPLLAILARRSGGTADVAELIQRAAGVAKIKETIAAEGPTRGVDREIAAGEGGEAMLMRDLIATIERQADEIARKDRALGDARVALITLVSNAKIDAVLPDHLCAVANEAIEATRAALSPQPEDRKNG